ncbi:hypothetical protein M2189_005972 [Bradyrhizobium japonicum]|uniref:hypothetical protein n=1 Tax=Bradyrhizobium japonicum TaxID=375 RepID=UPI0021675F2D|nr:hypothetical protein [Bradyrhizobium japonicum]MCS3495068.1 hypothetical protein [Bradyrhizobium japonicum]MCS3962769.1 hypothetical protein [Bradyrhizobium japonicum]MCS3995085.1 hypothetical protein [Bradyrhizobium japonicum]
MISVTMNRKPGGVAGLSLFHRDPPTGQFEAGAKVVLLYHDGGELCRVVDAAGRYVGTRFDGLRKI